MALIFLKRKISPENRRYSDFYSNLHKNSPVSVICLLLVKALRFIKKMLIQPNSSLDLTVSQRNRMSSPDCGSAFLCAASALRYNFGPVQKQICDSMLNIVANWLSIAKLVFEEGL